MSNDQIVKKFQKWIGEAFDSETVFKEHSITQDDIDNLRELLASSEYVPKAMIDKFFIMGLVTCENNVDKSVNLFHNYCKLMKETPEWFTNRDVESLEVQQAFDNQYYLSLPPIPGKNYHLIYHALSNFEPKNYIFDEAEKTFLMSIEAAMYHDGPRNGVVFLFDMKGTKIGHVFRPKLRSLRQLFKFIDYGCPFNIREVRTDLKILIKFFKFVKT